jgi:hypothetical protein
VTNVRNVTPNPRNCGFWNYWIGAQVPDVTWGTHIFQKHTFRERRDAHVDFEYILGYRKKKDVCIHTSGAFGKECIFKYS